jgi:hypothetical protein
MRISLIVGILLATTACTTDTDSVVAAAKPVVNCPSGYIRQGNHCVKQTPTPTPVAPTISISSATADENEGQLIFQLSRTGDLTNISTVQFTVSGQTALAGSDFVPLTSSVQFGTGEAVKNQVVSLVNDDVPEGTETLQATITASLNAQIGTGSAIGTITDSDVAQPPEPTPPPTFGPPDQTVQESVGSFQYFVPKTGDNGLLSIVHYEINPGHGTAVPGVDYVASSGDITVPAGATGFYIPVTIINDAEHEDPENFNITITPVTNAQVSRSGIITIADDDAVPEPPPEPTPSGWTVVPLKGAQYARAMKQCTLQEGQVINQGDVFTLLPNAWGWTPYRSEADVDVSPNPHPEGAYLLVGVPYNSTETVGLYLFSDCLEGLAPAQ